MAVTTVKTPSGHKIIDQPIAAQITDGAGDALVTFPYHGLGTADIVYITSDIDEYNGFWYVTAIDSNTFKISEYATADFVEFFQEIDIDYYQTNEHVWNSIFLPIVYKLSNDRWPINFIDPLRTVLSATNDNGYTNLNLSASIKTGVAALEYVEISGGSGDINGVWQIVDVINTGDITIDLPYSADNNFAGATVQYYYNNYQVKVKIYAGLPVTHPWESKKPYTEVAELSLTPDENNIVMFSVSDYIKSKVAIKNNTTLFSLPLNLDAFTGFFIATSETFDESDGYSLSTNESAFNSDTFEGYAIAGKLPFKNTYSGDYSDYVFTSGSPAKWLTILEKLLAVQGKYFDISFIKNEVGAFIMVIEKEVANYVMEIEEINFIDNGIGVYRLPVEVSAVFDKFCIQVKTVSSPAVPGVTTAFSLPALSTWANADVGTSWVTGATPQVSLVGGGIGSPASSKLLFADVTFVTGYSYTITVGYTKDSISGSSNPRAITVYALDSSNNVVFSLVSATPSGDGISSALLTFVAAINTTRLAVRCTEGSVVDIFINTITATQTTPGTPEVVGGNITEEICMDIIEDCEAQGGFTPSDIRLLEDGSYRLLE